MAFYVTHDTFITGDSNIVKGAGKHTKSGNVDKAANTDSNTSNRRADHSKESVNMTDKKDSPEYKPRDKVTLTSINTTQKTGKEDTRADRADRQPKTQYSAPGGVKAKFFIKIETVQNITLPSPRNARKNIQ